MKRTEKTIQNYKQQLKDKGIDDISEFVEMVISADITKGKYTRFLLDCFINDKFRVEDLQGGLESTVGQSVSLFHKHKSKLPEEMRSVTKYASPGDLWQAVKQYEQVMTGKEEKRSDKEKAYAETEFVYHDEASGFQIVSPLTEYSAKWWGKGTRWCTSAENNNQFEYYSKRSPLFVIIMPNGEKLQLWKYDNNGDEINFIDENDIQFMDEADNTVELDYIEANWEYLKEICLSLGNINYIPKKYLTQELYKILIEQDVWNVAYIPEQYRTPEIYQLAIKQNGWAIRFIPRKRRTPELYQLAVQQNGMALQFVQEEFKTPELCLLAVQQNGRALQHVPKKYITPKLCKLAVEQNGITLNSVPERYRNSELCKIAIQQKGEVLSFVPEKYKTSELCTIAINNYGRSLQFVPEKYKTFELCKIAIQQKGEVLSFIPKEYINPELCKLAVKQNGNALYYVPEQLKILELCKLAVKQNAYALQYVPENLKSEMVLPEFIMPDYTEQYNQLRSLFPEKELSLKP